MKIMQIYANKKEFKWIKFTENLNVILGVVNNNSDRESDSHNLGKSTLIAVIDFMLLKELNTGHFLKKNFKKFNEFVFFMEIKKDDQHYITIRRSVKQNSKIDLKFHTSPYQDFREESVWDHSKLPLTSKDSKKNPKELLNNYLNLAHTDKYNYRQFLGYFLRSQYDYDKVFKLAKFSGKLIDWKPALLDLLGFNGHLLEEKLSIEHQIELTKKYLQQMKEELNVTDYEIDVIKALIEAKEEDKSRVKKQIDNFDFYLKERNINAELVNKIENEISKLNTFEYNLKFEINKINESLNKKVQFSLSDIKTVFDEANIYFPDQIKKSYNQLVEFNKDITMERSEYQKKLLIKKNATLNEVRDKLKEHNSKRKDMLASLQEADSMAKFKRYQNELIEIENEISHLLQKLDNVDIIKSINKKQEDLNKEYESQIKKLNNELESNNNIYKVVKKTFRQLANKILNEPSILYYKVNSNNNPDFDTDFVNLDDDSNFSSQSDGYSYKKILCVCFDLALLITYANDNFFKFVYHDGTFESMADTKKIQYLDTIRYICEEYNIQYIMTALEDDIPRDENDNLYNFTDKEIALKLHDAPDNSGRLFSTKF